jgi:hypothetical protein
LYDTPKLFCPIVLLNTLGKMFEKMLSNRLQFEAAKHGVLHPNMFGGVCQNSTEASKLATSLQPKAGPSRASQVFFRPPTPAPASNSDNNMDAADVADPDPTITIPTSTPSLPQDYAAVMEGVEGDAFMDDFDDPQLLPTTWSRL